MSAAETAPTDIFLSEEFQTDPADVVARVRREDPVHYIRELDAWMVTRHEDVRSLFTDSRVTNDRRAYANYSLPPEGTTARWIAENGPFAAPPEQHARMRRLVSSALTPRAVKRMEQQVRDVVAQYAHPLRGRVGFVDLFEKFTEPVPNVVIGRIAGVPPNGTDELRWRTLGREAVRGVSPFLSPEERKRSEDAMTELCDYVRVLAAERRRRPEADLITDLVQTHDEDDQMTNDEIVLMVAGLVAAGTETTTIAATRGLRSLLLNKGEMRRLWRHPELMANAVDELMRFDFGSMGMPRYALEDFSFHGRDIKKGQLMLLSFIGAHRDPDVFPDPDKLDLGRDVKALTIFGHGPHYCLGANLARQELACMYEAALEFLPWCSSLVEDAVKWTRFGMFSRIESLPVDFHE